MAAQTGATLSNAAARELDAADADAKAYLALQATWKKDFHGNKSEAQAEGFSGAPVVGRAVRAARRGTGRFIPNATRTFCRMRRSGSTCWPVLLGRPSLL